VTAAGDATAVEVDSTLVLTATPDETLNPYLYAIEWTVDAETYGTISAEEGATTTLTGVSAGDIEITAEIMAITYVDGVRTLVSLDTPITDSITITVETAD
jgi:hypothetical protein